MAADSQNVYRYNVCLCSSVLLAEVLEPYCNPAGENELSFVVGTCVFLLLAWFGILSMLLSYREGKRCGCWLLIFLTKCGYCSSQPDLWNCRRLLQKSPDKTSSTTGSSAAIFLVDINPDPGPLASETSDQMIRFCRCDLFRFLSGKKVQFHLSRKKTTENSIEMVSALDHFSDDRRETRTIVSGQSAQTE